jgi:hypothetical protein
MNWKTKSSIGLLSSFGRDGYKFRLYENRVAISKVDGTRLTWEEVQEAKQLSIGDLVAIEVYPIEEETVNLRHTRHLWFSDNITCLVEKECIHEEFNQ